MNNCKLSPLIKQAVLYFISLFLFILFCCFFWCKIVFYCCAELLGMYHGKRGDWVKGLSSARLGSSASDCWTGTVLYVWTECIIDVKPKIYLRNTYLFCVLLKILTHRGPRIR